ncbi:10111_t:CDS:2, partial [Diversispora eburnea]
MTETADQLLSHVVPICQWIPQTSRNPSSTFSAYPRFPSDVKEWVGFFRGVRLKQYHIPGGQFPISSTIAQSLRVEKDAETRFYFNVLGPVQTLLGTQGATFCGRCPGLLGSPDYILCTNDSTVAKMPLEMKTRHNLNLCGRHLWKIYRKADRDQITNQNFQFKKKILSQVFGAMACNGLHYGILSNYSDTYFFKREEESKTTLHVSRVVQPNDTNPTLRECVYYISQLAINDRSVIASSSKGITTIDEYIGGGTFGKVFSGLYHGQAVAWKTCDAYKEKEAKKSLRVEANVYSILKECQGYVYDGYLYVLTLQLIEDARHIDPANLTVEEKRTIMQQLETIHSYGILHNDIAQRNILLEPKSHRFFFIDFGL